MKNEAKATRSDNEQAESALLLKSLELNLEATI